MENWKCFRNEQPELGKTVLIWRSNKRHLSYAIAKLENLNGKMIWKSLSGNSLKIEEKDWWYEFPLLTIWETYS